MSMPTRRRRDNWTADAHAQYDAIGLLLDDYLGAKNPLMKGTGCPDAEPSATLPRLKEGVELYDRVNDWMRGVWEGGYDGMTPFERELWDDVLCVSRSTRATDGQKRRALYRFARWLSKQYQRELNASSSATRANGSGADVAKWLDRIAQAAGDDNTARILAIASQQRPGEERMIEILGIDSRFGGKDSVEWGTLLDVTPECVRGWKTWKRLRQRERDRE